MFEPTLNSVAGLPRDLQDKHLRFYKAVKNKSVKHECIRTTLKRAFPKAHKIFTRKFGGRYNTSDVINYLFPSPKCQHCDRPYIIKYPNLTLYCCKKCGANNPNRLIKIKATTFKRTGYENASQDPNVKAKKKATTFKNYGVGNPSQSKVIIKRIQDTLEDRTGYRHAMQNPETSKRAMIKKEATCMKRYGVSNASKTEEVKAIIVGSYIKNFGTTHPMKTKEIFDKAMKASHRIKTYKYKGRKVKVQSTYEYKIFKELAKKYGSDDVLTQFDPEFPDYIFQEAGTWPDLYVKSIYTFIEVKSTWTMWDSPKFLKQNRHKAKLSNASGNNIRWVLLAYSKEVKGLVKTILPKDWYTMTTKELKALIE